MEQYYPRIIAIVVFFSLACLTSVVLTALVRELAPRLGLTDRPDGHRKLHARPTPLAGGVAILLSTVSVLGVALIQPNYFQAGLWAKSTDLFWLLVAGLIIVVVGLIDDRMALHGGQKLIGQIIAASVLLYGGLMIERFGLFGHVIELGVFAVPVTLFWLLGAMNALNLLDGIDGLATMLGIILAATIGLMAMMMFRFEVAIMAFVFAGSLVGFMRFNFPPASIFLGDTGSMLIGLMVGTLAIQGSLKGAGTVLLAAPLAVWAIPIFDSVAAIVRRKLTGRSIYATDRGHLHHRLLDLLGSNRKVLAWLAVCCVFTSVAALLTVFLKSDLIALLTCGAIVIIFIATGVFGRAEVLLLGDRLRRVGEALVPMSAPRQHRVRQTSIRLQGSRQWELLWETFTESADKLGLREMHLDVNLPAVQEAFHASWERPGLVDHVRCWRMEIPLMTENRSVGRLVIVGDQHSDSACQDLQHMLDLVEPFEAELLAVSQSQAPPPAAEADADGDVSLCHGRAAAEIAEKHTP